MFSGHPTLRRMDHLNHYDNEGLLREFQSAYKSHHSIETVLVRVQNEILKVIDNYRLVILLLLNLSAVLASIAKTATTFFETENTCKKI